MDGFSLPCWFSSTSFAWNLACELWVGIAWVSHTLYSSFSTRNSSLGFSTIVDTVSCWVGFNLGKTSVDCFCLPCWLTSACCTWNLVFQFWVGIAWVGYSSNSSFSYNSCLRFSSIVNSIKFRITCFSWFSFELCETSMDSFSLPCGFTSACLSWKLTSKFWISITRIGYTGNSSFSGNSSLGFSSIVYSIKFRISCLSWCCFELGKTTMDSFSLPCWLSSASFAWNLACELWVGVAWVSHTLYSSFSSNSSLRFSTIVDTVSCWVGFNLSKGSCRSAIGVYNTHSFSRWIAYW